MSEQTSTRKVAVYGASWCGDCIRSMNFLDELGVGYDYINIDQDEKAAQVVEKLNKGYRSIPTIVFPDGTILTEPSNQQLETSIKKHS